MIKTGFSLLILLITLLAACPRQSQADLPTLTVLHTFSPGGLDDLTPSHHINLDGSRPDSPLLQGSDGALYGTAPDGGTNGTGVIFKVGVDGTGFAVLHSFGPLAALFGNETNADGCRPRGGLVSGSDGALYGVTGQAGPGGSGTIFKLNSNGSGFTLLHTFGPKGEVYRNDGGAQPEGVTVGSDQMLYGVTAFGGEDGRGLIFRMEQNGKKFHVLHLFHAVDYDDNVNEGGGIPTASVTFGRDGSLFGMTNIGGRQGYGVIYKMDADGKHFTLLHHFRRKGGDYKNNGAFPTGVLTLGPDNFVYGCTRQGGEADGGTVFKMNADGTAFNVLHTFSDPNSESEDETLPAGPLVFRNAGRLYGLANGGAGGLGVLFWVSTDGAKLAVPHDFSAAEGGSAFAGLTLGRDGSLYGVSAGGGANGTGTIFRVTFPAAK